MNNRYIFRGKRKDTKNWVYGNFCRGNERQSLHDSIFVYDCETQSFDNYDIIPETVGQCSGLTDKNGKLIFEGDVVKADGYIFIVKFGKCGGVANDENYGYIGYYLDGFDSMTKKVLRFGLRNDICYFTDIEVIGNIHDDDLLEVGR